MIDRMADRWVVKDDKNYFIYGNSYNIKDKIKALGGRWNAERKRWELPKYEKELAFLRENHIPFKVRVKADGYCHEPPEVIYLFEGDIVNGYWIGTKFCGNCDSHYRDPVKVEILDS